MEDFDETLLKKMPMMQNLYIFHQNVKVKLYELLVELVVELDQLKVA
jgi:hypothetical protein